jgi:hypothetical protein
MGDERAERNFDGDIDVNYDCDRDFDPDVNDSHNF